MYKRKYPITDEDYQKDEIRKIIKGVDKEMKQQEEWKMLTSALLFAFTIVAIMILMGVIR